jgi:uncharacterized membrane protein YedE/YeeE
MLEPEYLRGLIGGGLIGAASLLAAAVTGKVPGISGVVSRAIQGASGDRAWRWIFLVGLVGGASAAFAWVPGAADFRPAGPLSLFAAAGLLVGLGTRIGGGCTSGHGVCGLGTGSRASFVAVCVFMATAMAAVFAVRMSGGRS